MRGYIILLLLAFIFIVPLSSAAIMVSPGSYNVNFEPNLKANYDFTFFVDDNTLLQIYAAGDLAQYVKLSTDSIKGQGTVTASVSLPASIDVPGLHVISIGARQAPSPGQQGFGLVGNVLGQIEIFVPYPGQYATFDLSANNANVGQNVTFSGSVNNLGKEFITARAFADVYLNNTKVTRVDLGSFSLNASTKQAFSSDMDSHGMLPGNYNAIGTLMYGDSHIIQNNLSFKLGELKVSILNYTSSFQRDKINRMEIEVESHWNDPIQGVYANVTLIGYPISFTTPTISLQGFDTGTLTGFFDTTGLNDSFEAAITLNYAGKSENEVVNLSLEKKNDYMPVILVSAILFVAILIALTVILKRRKKSK